MKSPLLLLVFSFISTLFYGQVSVTATAGTPGPTSYTTLKASFDAINAGTHQGVIVIMVDANTTEAASAVINASGSGSASYTSINIYPTVTGLSVSGNLAAPLIDLNGADNVTIDGRVNATGSTKDLIITNTSTLSTVGTSTIRFINDASSNMVKYCTIKGSSTSASLGIILFSTTTGSTGNDGNTIDNNNITNSADANRPLNAIYSAGTSAKTNSGNIMSNNNVYDFLSRSTSSNGIQLAANNTGWSISNNSFYETASFIPSGAGTYYIIYASDVTVTDISISGNYIGGSASNCGGSAWTKTNVQSNPITAINLIVGPTTSTISSIQGNTMQNFIWGDAGATSWIAININDLTTGDVNIGTVTGNTIGASSGTGSIAYTPGATNATFWGIRIAGSGIVDCENNTVASITAANSSTFATNIYGINKIAAAGTTIISNNTIGSTTTANS
ncbi:MAG: hypothetical protein WCJ85_12510, partial [Chitinophagaceae bacterium]